MSKENVESLKALYKQWARGDWADTSIGPSAVEGRFAWKCSMASPKPSKPPGCGSRALTTSTRVSFLGTWVTE
jgi:hypothetical protein